MLNINACCEQFGFGSPHWDSRLYNDINEESTKETDMDGNTLLHRECSGAPTPLKVDRVRYLVERGADVNARNNDRCTPLHIACRSNFMRAALCLIEQGAKVKREDKDGNTPLHLILKDMRDNGIDALHIEVIKKLLEKGVKIDAPNQERETPNNLANLLPEGREKEVILRRFQTILEDVNYRDHNGNTPLYYAFESRDEARIRALVEQGAKLKDIGKGEGLALHRACKLGSVELVRFLTEHGADVNAVSAVTGWRALHKACSCGGLNPGGLDVVRFLVEEKGADIHATTKQLNTPLHCACERGSIEIVRYLVERGADKNAVNSMRVTPLYFACKSGSIDIVRCLVEGGADKNVVDEFGATLLHLACKSGFIDIVRYLVEKGADKNVVDEVGVTPLHQALRAGRIECARFLMEAVSAERNTLLYQRPMWDQTAIQTFFRLVSDKQIVNYQNERRDTALHVMLRDVQKGTLKFTRYFAGAVEELVRNGAKTDLENEARETAQSLVEAWPEGVLKRRILKIFQDAALNT